MGRPAHSELSKPGRGRRWSDFIHRRHRLTVALFLLFILFVGMVALGSVQPSGTLELLDKNDPIETLYQALLTATVTGVTLVLTISQLVLSQELGAIGDQRQRLQGALDFQDDFESLSGEDVTPAEPASFFMAILDSLQTRGTAVREALEHAGLGDDDSASFVDELADDAEELSSQLEGAEFGHFEVVWYALGFDYSKMTHCARRLLSQHGDALDEDGVGATHELIDLLEMFGAAREHFKTLFFQWQLTDLSRWIMASAIPAILASAVMLTYFEPADFPGTLLGIGTAHLFVAASTTLSLAPFAILVSFMARIMSVTQRTLSIGPFILRTTDA
jgi:hypothetical protein